MSTEFTDLSESLDSLAATALKIKAQRDALVKVLGRFTCPACDHGLDRHLDHYGCTFERGDHLVGEVLMAAGPCSCKCEGYEEFEDAVAVMQEVGDVL